MTSALVTSNAAPAVVAAVETYERLQAVRNALAPDLNDQELQLFALVAQRSGLDPFAKQIHAIKRGGRVTFQTGIDGYRSTAARTGEYDGSDEPVFGEMVNGHPVSATVTVYRFKEGRRVPQSATAYWDEFNPGNGQDHMWRKMPRNQLAKCAEALALRKAFPYVLADVYIAEEMDQAGPGDNAAAIAAAAKPTAAERIAARREAIEETAGKVREEAATTEAVTEGEIVPEPVAGGCGWRLGQGQGKPSLPCELPEMHEGEHSWHEIAVREGGRVIRPE